MIYNPLGYIRHLKGAGPSLRERVSEAAAALEAIDRLRSQLAALEAHVAASVAANWTPDEVAEAKASTLAELQKSS